ncbi:MAG TPA: acetyl-CoA carboxylase carboxyl transferase subunit alpha [Fibrobacteres bacterium]|jgi:acetyl-CoA carboxylase carboxyl transferase subunit alpha|nr:acetyl-CoA carboxylase carboxyl transferase subunit alpha [Fibrobacterota bacterium]
MSIPKGPHLEFEQPVVELAVKIEDLLKTGEITNKDVEDLIAKKEALQRKIAGKMTSWNRVELARRPSRPYTLDYIQRLCTDFVELRGDRCFGDDPALVTGLARLGDVSVVVMGQQKGRDTKESIRRNFGMAHPEGYRKALRCMKMAEKFNLPIIAFIDTPGAFPGIGAEERGQAEAIARNLMEMAVLKTPIIAVVIGEGASGGALGIGVADRILMLENAWFGVISPESCSAILWGDSSKKQDLSGTMKITATDLKELKIVDRIVKEPLGGAHWDPDSMYDMLKSVLVEELEALRGVTSEELVEKRMAKYAGMARFSEK